MQHQVRREGKAELSHEVQLPEAVPSSLELAYLGV